MNGCMLLTVVKRHTCHLSVNTHCCVFRHCWRQASRTLCVCVFFFLAIWFGHNNVWCASTQSHTHTCLCIHTFRPSSTCPNCFPFLLISISVSPLSCYACFSLFATSDFEYKHISNCAHFLGNWLQPRGRLHGCLLTPFPLLRMEKKVGNDLKRPCWSQCVSATKWFPLPSICCSRATSPPRH